MNARNTDSKTISQIRHREKLARDKVLEAIFRYAVRSELLAYDPTNIQLQAWCGSFGRLYAKRRRHDAALDALARLGVDVTGMEFKQ